MDIRIVDPELMTALNRAKYSDRDEAVRLCFRAQDALVRLEHDYIATRDMLKSLVAARRIAGSCPCACPRCAAHQGAGGGRAS